MPVTIDDSNAVGRRPFRDHDGHVSSTVAGALPAHDDDRLRGIMLAVETVPDAGRDATCEAMLAALEPYYPGVDDEIEREYQLVTATVAG